MTKSNLIVGMGEREEEVGRVSSSRTSAKPVVRQFPELTEPVAIDRFTTETPEGQALARQNSEAVVDFQPEEIVEKHERVGGDQAARCPVWFAGCRCLDLAGRLQARCSRSLPDACPCPRLRP